MKLASVATLVLSLLVLLSGCARPVAPESSSCENASPPVQAGGFGEFFAAVVTTAVKPHDERQRAALQRFGVLLSAELAKTGTLAEDSPSPGMPWLRGVECRAGMALEQALKPLAEQRPYVLVTPDDVAELERAFAPEALDRRMNEIAETLDALPADALERRRLQSDPLNVLNRAAETLRRRVQSTSAAFADADGWYISADGTMLLVVARTADAGNPAPEKLRAAAERAYARALSKLRAKTAAAENSEPAVSVDFVTADASPDARTKVSDRFGRSLDEVRVVLEAGDEAALRAGANDVAARLQSEFKRGDLARITTVLDIIPPVEAQQRNFAALKNFNFDAALKAFQTAAQKRFGTHGLVFFKPFLQRFEKFHLLTREPQPLTLGEALDGPLGHELAPYLKRSPDGKLRWMIALFPRPASAATDAQILEQHPPPGVSIRVETRR